MIIKPVKPASGLAIRNAFQYATLGMLGDKRYTKSHEEPRGQMIYDFSSKRKAKEKKPLITPDTGDSVRISNAAGKTVRISLVPLRDNKLYKQFQILAVGVSREFEYTKLEAFGSELDELIALMNKRLSMWGKDSSEAA